VLPTHHLLAFILTSTAIVLVPGPSVLFVITRSLTLGRRAGLATVVGNATGVYVQIMAVAFGVGAIVERSIAVFTVVKLVGGAYLIYLGVNAVRHRSALAAALGATTPPTSVRRIVRDAFVVGIANPKTIVFFAAALPPFIDRGAGHVPLQLLSLGGVFFVIALACDSTWALAAGTARAWLMRDPRRLERIGGAGGIVMMGLGLRVAVSGRGS
jgi:threonine/homoserine/homoserine lactone efflux protein